MSLRRHNKIVGGRECSETAQNSISNLGIIAKLKTYDGLRTERLMEKRPHCRFNALAVGALIGVQFVAGVFGFNPKMPHRRLALWTVGSDS